MIIEQTYLKQINVAFTEQNNKITIYKLRWQNIWYKV